MKTFEEFWKSYKSENDWVDIKFSFEDYDLENEVEEIAEEVWNVATEAAKPLWKPILPETFFDADTDYLVRRKDEQYYGGYDVQLCHYENDHHDKFFWWNGNDEFPQDYFHEYMEIPK